MNARCTRACAFCNVAAVLESLDPIEAYDVRSAIIGIGITFIVVTACATACGKHHAVLRLAPPDVANHYCEKLPASMVQ